VSVSVGDIDGVADAVAEEGFECALAGMSFPGVSGSYACVFWVADSLVRL